MANSVTRMLLIKEAQKRGLNCTTLGPNAKYLCISDNHDRTEIFLGSCSFRNSKIGSDICKSKVMTLRFVESLGYHVPDSVMIRDTADVKEFLKRHTSIVIKPSDGGQSKGVTVGVSTEEQARQACQLATSFSKSGTVVAQAQIVGRLYRIFVLDGEVPVVTESRAAFVTGDGVHSIQELVDIKNLDPRRSVGSSTPLKKIKIDEVTLFLGEELTQSIPESGTTIVVSRTDSINEGGDAVNVTDQCHSTWIEAAATITKSLQLFTAGFDIMCPDISRPMVDNYIPLLEINSIAGLKVHEYPSEGEPVHLAEMIIGKLFK